TVALVAVIVHEATSIIILGTAAAAGTAITISGGALAAAGGGALLLGAAGLLGGAIGFHKASRGGRSRSRGHHRGGYGGYRGRRSLTGGLIADDGFSVNAVDVLFATASAVDQETNCGAKLVCELSTRPVDQLADDEALLISLFADQTPLNLDQVNDPSTPFQLAAFLGKNSLSAAACENTYTKCKLNGSQIMEILRQNGNGQL
ncbi:unnamed protein product, partial [Meganyctiphanes norvegica]